MPRHAIQLNPAIWHAVDTWAAPNHAPTATWPEGESFTIRHPLNTTLRFRIGVARGKLEIAGEITPPPPPPEQTSAAKPFTPMPEWYLGDHVVIYLDPAHDHTTQRMLAVLRSGELKTQDTWFLNGEEVADTQSVALSLPSLEATLVVREGAGGGWRFRLQIPLTRLRKQANVTFPTGPMGLRIKFACAGAVIFDAPAWPLTDPFWKDGPFGFGDLYAPAKVSATKSAPAAVRDGEPPLTITQVDFGRPVWQTGAVQSRLQVAGRIAEHAPRRGKVTLTVTDTLGRKSARTTAWQAQGGARDARLVLDLPVAYPFTSKWAPDIRHIARLSVRVADAAGRALWQASYPFGFDAGVIVREPFGDLNGKRGKRGKRGTRGKPGGAAAQPKRPRASARDFVDRYRAWLLTTLPAWQWQTTRDGAPSDFFLAVPSDPTASAGDRKSAYRSQHHPDCLNLMSPTVFADLAQIIRRHFADWQDGLCAAAMALHHPCLTVHSSVWARVAANAHTDTVLRLGGAFCSEDARIAARLAEELGQLYRVPLRGFELGLRGHLTGLIETPLGELLIDPMLGLYYHTLDNTRLATLDEMRKDQRIHRRMWSRAENHGHEFFYKFHLQIKRPWLNGPTQFPPGT